MSATEDSLAHTRWECKYHIVFIPKYRKKSMFAKLRPALGEVLRELAIQKECDIMEGHLPADHVHMLMSIPPKHAVSQVVGHVKGKSAIWIARNYYGKRTNFTGQHFWARGHCVSTVGHGERMVREYIRNQERRDQQEDRQLGLGL